MDDGYSWGNTVTEKECEEHCKEFACYECPIRKQCDVGLTIASNCKLTIDPITLAGHLISRKLQKGKTISIPSLDIKLKL